MTIEAPNTPSPLQAVPSLVNTARCAVLFSIFVYHGMLSLAISSSITSTGFYIWSLTYFIIILIAVFTPKNHSRIQAIQPISGSIDILMMVLLMYLSGGIDSGIGILILPFVSTACLMSYGRYSFAYAAFATILIFFFSYLNLYTGFVRPHSISDTYSIFNAGLLSAAAFLVAWLTSFAVRHVRRATTTISQHQEQITRLSQLNSLVLNRVQEAVVVIDQSHNILLHNAQATIYFSPDLLVQNNKQNIFQPVIRTWKKLNVSNFEYNGEIDHLAVRVRAIAMDEIQPPILMLFIRSEDDIYQDSQADKLAALGQLTANIAHEIRNPLSAIRHANELICEANPSPFTQKLEKMINSNINRIDKLLEDVLAINKRLKPNIESIDLNIFLTEFLQHIYLSTPELENKIEINYFTENTIILFDKTQLQQVLWNLINNAWRHSKQDQDAIKIQIRPSRNKNLLRLGIQDNGPGIPPEIYHKIFEPFFTTETKGTGLGLFIARELTQSNNASLQYLSDQNSFELSLPRKKHE